MADPIIRNLPPSESINASSSDIPEVSQDVALCCCYGTCLCVCFIVYLLCLVFVDSDFK